MTTSVLRPASYLALTVVPFTTDLDFVFFLTVGSASVAFSSSFKLNRLLLLDSLLRILKDDFPDFERDFPGVLAVESRAV